MADKGIIFSAPMVRALLDGRKTQTRRLLKVETATLSPPFHPERRGDRRWVFMQRDDFPGYSFAGGDFKVPYAPGDRLYVREGWACHWATDNQKPRDIDPELWSVRYLADDVIRPAARDGSKALLEQCRKGRPSIFMPRWASRLTLTVTDVRVQRLQEISREDAIAEGIQRVGGGMLRWENWTGAEGQCGMSPEAAYALLWNSLHTKPGERWNDNPWICAVSFAVEQRNIDTQPTPPETQTKADRAPMGGEGR